MEILKETRVSSPATYIISDVFTISTLCSLKSAAVNRDNVKDIVSAHTGIWALIDVTLYHSLTVIYFNNLPLLTFSSIINQGIFLQPPFLCLQTLFMWGIEPIALTKRVEEVKQKLQENNIDISQFLEWPVDHCPKGEFKQRKKDPNRETGEK